MWNCVGWISSAGTFPPNAVAFRWTQVHGMAESLLFLESLFLQCWWSDFTVGSLVADGFLPPGFTGWTGKVKRDEADFPEQKPLFSSEENWNLSDYLPSEKSQHWHNLKQLFACLTTGRQVWKCRPENCQITFIKDYVKYKNIQDVLLLYRWFPGNPAKKPNQQKITCITHFNMSDSFLLQLGGCLTQMPRNELQNVLYL